MAFEWLFMCTSASAGGAELSPANRSPRTWRPSSGPSRRERKRKWKRQRQRHEVNFIYALTFRARISSQIKQWPNPARSPHSPGPTAARRETYLKCNKYKWKRANRMPAASVCLASTILQESQAISLLSVLELQRKCESTL